MWIVPKGMMSNFNGGSDGAMAIDDKSASEACSSSLFRRSCRSQPRSYLKEWKAGRYSRLRSGVIPPGSASSMAFSEWWTGTLGPSVDIGDSPAGNPVAGGRRDAPESASAWKKMVEGRRREYSCRIRDFRRENPGDNWPTICPAHMRNHEEPLEEYYRRVQDWRDGRTKGKPGKSLGVAARESWTTHQAQDGKHGNLSPANANRDLPCSEVMHTAKENDGWPTPQSGDSKVCMTGTQNQRMLPHAVSEHASTPGLRARNWATPQAFDHVDFIRSKEKLAKTRMEKDAGCMNLREQVHYPDMTHSRSNQEAKDAGKDDRECIDWRTPMANEAGARVESLYTKDGNPAIPGQRAYRMTKDGRMVLQSQTINQQVEMVERKSWPTARSLDGQVNESLDTWTSRRDRKAAEGINLHRPLPIAVMQEDLQKRYGAWPTPMQMDHWMTNRPRNDGRQEQLPNAVQTWATPQCKDSKSGKGNAERQYKELSSSIERQSTGRLNPRWVETLMGIPVGWVMPNCGKPLDTRLLKLPGENG